MPDLSGLDTAAFDLDRTGSDDFTFDDIHADTEVLTALFENDEDTRGDNYFTGSNVDVTLTLPDMDDDSGTTQTSTLITEMTEGDYHRVTLTKYDGTSVIVDKTKIRVQQTTNPQVGNVDAWEIMLYDVDTSGIFYWS